MRTEEAEAQKAGGSCSPEAPFPLIEGDDFDQFLLSARSAENPSFLPSESLEADNQLTASPHVTPWSLQRPKKCS